MNRVRTQGRNWVRVISGEERPAARLVCFPHSGGTAAAYRDWSSAMPAGTQLLAVQYPGLADRIREAPAGLITEIASCVGAELSLLDPARCVLFGHSLGALAAYETARVLQAVGRPAHGLVVSGSLAPGQAHGGAMHRAGDAELWSILRDFGGIDPSIADDQELRDLLLPPLRAYIELTETYRPAAGPEPLHCQVRCHYNTGDPLMDPARVEPWAAVTTGRTGVRVRPGGHFGSLSEPSELIADISEVLLEGPALP
ncbi:thioesterase II family protein [Streptomyces paludis]|uniref:thioesterase II family protein n=1 Tax=Streptomyces paludis TaxID=2282738 RepID=UPI0013B3574D|nr:alpha/beta fold hydrolase [Streptomyces paludis]